MGLSRWLQAREIKNDLKIIRQLPSEARSLLLEEYFAGEAYIRAKMRIDVPEIIDSKSFHIVENANWAFDLRRINQEYRMHLLRLGRAGDDFMLTKYLAVGIIVHSIRAILDYELNGRKDLILYCQTLWYELAEGNHEFIPERFLGDVNEKGKHESS